MRRIALAVAVSTLFVSQSARANDVLASVEKAKDGVITANSPSKDAAASDPKDESAPPLKLATQPAGFPTGRIALSGLYVGFAAFQAYDVYSTRKAISGGATEASPHLRGLVDNPLAFVGLKVAMTAGPIYEAERLWRSHHRVGAIALMAASNGIMMAVAAHNASVMNQPVTVR